MKRISILLFVILFPNFVFAQASSSASAYADETGSYSESSAQADSTVSESQASTIFDYSETIEIQNYEIVYEYNENIARRSTPFVQSQHIIENPSVEETASQENIASLGLPQNLEKVIATSQALEKQNINILKTLIVILAGLIIITIINIWNFIITKRIYGFRSQVI